MLSLNDNSAQNISGGLGAMADNLVMVNDGLLKLANEINFNVIPALQSLTALKPGIESLNTQIGFLTGDIMGLRSVLMSLSTDYSANNGSNETTNGTSNNSNDTLDKVDKWLDIIGNGLGIVSGAADIYKTIQAAQGATKAAEIAEEVGEYAEIGEDIAEGLGTLTELFAGASALEVVGDIIGTVLLPEVFIPLTIAAATATASYGAYKLASTSQTSTTSQTSADDNFTPAQPPTVPDNNATYNTTGDGFISSDAIHPLSDEQLQQMNAGVNQLNGNTAGTYPGNSLSSTAGSMGLGAANSTGKDSTGTANPNNYTWSPSQGLSSPGEILGPQNSHYQVQPNPGDALQPAEQQHINTNPCCNKIVTQTQINNIYIQNVVENFTVTTNNTQDSVAQIKVLISQALVQAVSDFHIKSAVGQ